MLFTQGVQTGCGFADVNVGPFYCPPDERVYIDLSFYDELRRRFGAPGDFAQAYVVAHEIGHHVQRLLGIEDRVRQQQAARPDQQNALSVRLELQADCFAGVWAASARGRDLLEPGDIEEGMGAAAAGRRRPAAERRRPDACARTRSRTAAPRSACSGSGAACRAARSRRATRSRRRD